MGYLSTHVLLDTMKSQVEEDINLDDSIGPAKRKQFYVLDFETRLFGMLTGPNLNKARGFTFTQLKSVQSINRMV